MRMTVSDVQLIGQIDSVGRLSADSSWAGYVLSYNSLMVKFSVFLQNITHFTPVTLRCHL